MCWVHSIGAVVLWFAGLTFLPHLPQWSWEVYGEWNSTQAFIVTWLNWDWYEVCHLWKWVGKLTTLSLWQRRGAMIPTSTRQIQFMMLNLVSFEKPPPHGEPRTVGGNITNNDATDRRACLHCCPYGVRRLSGEWVAKWLLMNYHGELVLNLVWLLET